LGLSSFIYQSAAVGALRYKSSPLVPRGCGLSTSIPQLFILRNIIKQLHKAIAQLFRQYLLHTLSGHRKRYIGKFYKTGGVSELGSIEGFIILSIIGIGKSTPVSMASPALRIGKNDKALLLASEQAYSIASLSCWFIKR